MVVKTNRFKTVGDNPFTDMADVAGNADPPHNPYNRTD